MCLSASGQARRSLYEAAAAVTGDQPTPGSWLVGSEPTELVGLRRTGWCRAWSAEAEIPRSRRSLRCQSSFWSNAQGRVHARSDRAQPVQRQEVTRSRLESQTHQLWSVSADPPTCAGLVGQLIEGLNLAALACWARQPERNHNCLHFVAAPPEHLMLGHGIPWRRACKSSAAVFARHARTVLWTSDFSA